MPATTTRVSGAVSRMLESGQISRVVEGTGVLQTLHADCPDDGTRSSVRRMTRELGGPVMEVIMRCPACFNDFVATPAMLYVYPRTAGGSTAKSAPAAKTAKTATKAAAPKAPATKAAAKKAPAAKSAAKSAAKKTTATK